MPPTVHVPCQVSDEAEAYVAELGLQDAFAEMLEHTRQTVPGLRAIEVILQPPYDVGGGPCVLIQPVREDPNLFDDSTDRDLNFWRLTHFPPETFQHFCFLGYYSIESNHAG